MDPQAWINQYPHPLASCHPSTNATQVPQFSLSAIKGTPLKIMFRKTTSLCDSFPSGQAPSSSSREVLLLPRKVSSSPRYTLMSRHQGVPYGIRTKTMARQYALPLIDITRKASNWHNLILPHSPPKTTIPWPNCSPYQGDQSQCLLRL